jgi:hypothetical protein
MYSAEEQISAHHDSQGGKGRIILTGVINMYGVAEGNSAVT